MARIHSYPLKAVPAAGDKLVISNAADGNNTYSIDVSTLGGGSGGAFEEIGNIVQQTVAGASYAEDFVFGSPQLDDDAVLAHQSRFFFDESKSAFRAGRDNLGWWDDAINRGSYSVGFGYNTVARGNYSFAHGYNCFATGAGSFAVGSTTTVTFDRTYAYGEDAIAIGRLVKAVGNQSISIGDMGEAISRSSVCMGSGNVAGAEYSVAMGSNTKSLGADSAVFGLSNTVGHPAQSASIAGSVVTIVGDVTAYFTNGAEVAFWGCDSGPNYVASFTDTINTVAFGGVNTTFNLDSGPTAAVNATCAVIDGVFGQYSFAAGQSNDVAGTWSGAIGRLNEVSGDYSFSSGNSNVISGNYSSCSGGRHIITANNSFANGDSNTISNSYCFVTGQAVETGASYSTGIGIASKTSIVGSLAHATGYFTNIGDAQYQRVVVSEDTVDATPTVLEVWGAGIPIALGKTYMFNVDIVAAQTAAGGGGVIGDSWAYNIKGVIQNLAGTTQILGFPIVTTILEADTSFSVEALENDPANTLEITVTGAAAKPVRWVATVHLTEVAFV